LNRFQIFCLSKQIAAPTDSFIIIANAISSYCILIDLRVQINAKCLLDLTFSFSLGTNDDGDVDARIDLTKVCRLMAKDSDSDGNLQFRMLDSR